MQANTTTVTANDVTLARSRIRPYLPPTPLVQPPALAAALNLDIWLKLETAQPVGAFKVRGGINFIAANAERLRPVGVVTASTGNHGQSIAYAARLFDVPATIFVPENANPAKVESMRAMGARVELSGRDSADSMDAAEAYAQRTNSHFVSSGNEPLLIAGVGTAAMEALEQQMFDVMIVPAAAGTHAAGTAVVAKAFSPGIRVVAVCSAQAPAIRDAWTSGRPVIHDSLSTICEGLATRRSYELTQDLLRTHLDGFEALDDAEILDAMRFIIKHARQLVEPAGAAALAYVMRHRSELKGARVYVPLTGANISYAQLQAHLLDE